MSSVYVCVVCMHMYFSVCICTWLYSLEVNVMYLLFHTTHHFFDTGSLLLSSKSGNSPASFFLELGLYSLLLRLPFQLGSGNPISGITLAP